MTLIQRFASVVALGMLACGTSSTSVATPGVVPTRRAVVKTYATLVHANYDDALMQMRNLKAAVDAFVALPTQARFDAARVAWVTARPSYLQTEGFRFYNGPIDNAETGHEGMINGWPMDENFVDYTVDAPEAGLINLKKADGTFFAPQITKAVIADENEKGGQKNLSTGWHTIEFLLWGQDFNKAGPGNRPFTDFVDGGTAKNQSRRRAYLAACADLMVEQFAEVAAAWELAKADTFGAKMLVGDADEALGKILKGIGSLAGTELAKQRMNNAYQTKDQEEEHSCFSDTTNQDLVFNGVGIENVYLGRYSTSLGVSLSDLVRSTDASLDDKTKRDLSAAIESTRRIPQPFDQAILGADDSDGRVKIKSAIDAWAVVTSDIVAVSANLGVTINLVE